MNNAHPPPYAAQQQPAIKPFIDDNAAMRLLLPIKVSPLAMAAGYLGLFAMVLLPAPLALLVGVAAVADLRRNPEKRGMGRAVFGVFMGAVGTAGLIFTLIK
jgi:hypothetical protein